jgi:hypothetical protein
VNNQELQEHILSTYNSMRLGMGWIAVGLLSFRRQLAKLHQRILLRTAR